MKFGEITEKIIELKQRLNDISEDLDRLEIAIKRIEQEIPDCADCDARRHAEDPEPPFDWREDEDYR